jgi:hypothetical protein
MKTRPILLMLAVCAMAVAAWSADNPQMGTWQLDEAKSKLAPGVAKVTKTVYEAMGDQVKVTVYATAPDGTTSTTEWTGKFDGKPYPVTGGANPATRSYRAINARTMSFVQKEGDKVVTSGRIVVAADGKSRVVTSLATNAKGVKVRSVAVYDKEM